MNTSAQQSDTLKLTEAEAFAGIVIASAASDYKLSNQEVKFIHFMFSRMRLFKDWTTAQYDDMFARLLGMLKEKPTNEFLDLCIHSLPQQLYRTAFAAAIDLTVSDGYLSDEEKDFLYDLQRKMGLDTDIANRIIEVILIKNRG
ncbi:hypothetical protein U14_02791 [Candidatus Moduliflexus flocculans]|uniref:Co-chaperone DjlA N-terminal domain-containing protein n=1 Tax=Candidatus Moduliflexus flocculans TaxID=1499966 RepID=A0A081BMD0_9BACT|nr:hypothetical protein U14_02791 [Candidatus Moduliflexus flocculans]